ncbi:MAG: phosphonate C-P lyase system protein PhnL [Pseudomonadota bacterium]
MITVCDVGKSFTLHNQGATTIDVIGAATFSVAPGECVALTGASGTGKSTLLRMIYGNYLASKGSITVGGVNISAARPREIMALRRDTLGYVSQYLRVVPRVPAVDVVAEPLLRLGESTDAALDRARELLTRVHLPEPMWRLSPTTFSGGEQQRDNVARGVVHAYPVLLLDEPTASLDDKNRNVVLALIEEAKSKGSAIVGIFHDEAARARVCDREIDVRSFRPQGGDA